MRVVIDTNILVSALWSKNGAPAQIISMVISGLLIPCYDYRILNEYKTVLKRPKFGFSTGEINSLLAWFETSGVSVTIYLKMKRTKSFTRSRNIAMRNL